ncbi:type III restriction-modification system endonuclease [Helicobacter fennelliae]|uniref:Type III restriction-modification system restriction subunit n=1 Tax=Helicobacter fennelliae MRY12-0050 TaxID=1325130 RepID=T1CP15_9HELI|nr:type III restriction-modification system endonuclease [Helicobacter fennelliae]GAD18504.1 type III restriction-modification system restriction subunit [Helicobacter fennelliae MRY12-0050]STP08133.1 type III restriction-modification system restriction subunit [Helicobacter fennelliae]
MGFSYERNLPHQSKAIDCVLLALKGASVEASLNKSFNPKISINDLNLSANLRELQKRENINSLHTLTRVFDVCMETGTGKTYTYTKMALELCKEFGLRKFIIIVPSLAIKANTLNFLQAVATREHFKSEFELEIIANAIEAKKQAGKKGRKLMPNGLRDFIENDNPKEVHFLIINAQMLTATSMNEDYEQNLCDEFSNPYDALNAVNAVCIVDEPHRFDETNKAWARIVNKTEKAINPQMIFRYGATFKEDGRGNKYHNLIYQLNAISAFNDNLVKGVEISVCEAQGSEKHKWVEFSGIENNQAKFELKEQGKSGVLRQVRLNAGESLGVIDENLAHLCVEIKTAKSKAITKFKLNNQDDNNELKKGDRINLNAYLPQMQTQMLQTALKKHFELEKRLMQSQTKIKPLTLFFIEDIESYRSDDATREFLRIEFEKIAENLMRENLKEASGFYKEYLEKSLRDLRGISGGYFSKDNSNKEEYVVSEINEILHDKEKLLSCENIRRFIFSKWTLREGWDNPNVFVICKLRSSGSEISKLQEVGRGLRLPVNEYMSRVGNDGDFGAHYLHYIVNDSERDFAQSLISDINAQSGVIFSENATKLDNAMIDKLCEVSGLSRLKLQMELVEKGVIDEDLVFLENGMLKLKELYPNAFDKENLQKDKVRQSGKTQTKAHIRRDNYKILQELWETINQKVILEYKIQSEAKFEALLEEFLRDFTQKAVNSSVITTTKRLETHNQQANLQEVLLTSNTQELRYQAMSEDEFVKEGANALLANINTLRKVLKQVGFDEKFYNQRNVAMLKSEFNRFLFENAISGFEVGFAKISSATQPNLHPTAFTDTNGKPYEAIESSNLGIESSDEITPKNYLFDELFYDSAIERENILQNVDRVLVFTKIPKNALKIPVAGGISYTPDFAYVLKCENGEQIYCIIESKGKDLRDLSKVENLKISRAEQFLEKSGIFGAKIQFRAQFESEAITKILQEFLNKNDI